MRKCSDCTLCCKLLPVREMQKKAGERCRNQRLHGCAVYMKRGFPASCELWSCRWLVNDDTADLRRPDRSHYVIDVMPDFVTVQPHDGSEPTNIAVVQVWCDPKHPDAWRDPELLRYLERRGAQDGMAALVRFNSQDGVTVFPPALSADGQWHEVRGSSERERSAAERWDGIAQAKRVKVG